MPHTIASSTQSLSLSLSVCLSLSLSDFFELGLHYLAQAGLEFMILLPQPPKVWNYKYAPLHSVMGILMS
jgi:hypothetical protein